jgi:hypothetical protein
VAAYGVAARSEVSSHRLIRDVRSAEGHSRGYVRTGERVGFGLLGRCARHNDQARESNKKGNEGTSHIKPSFLGPLGPAAS